MPVDVIPEQQLTPVHQVSPQFNANQSAIFRLTLTSTEWDDPSKKDIEVNLHVFESRDNGSTWVHMVGMGVVVPTRTRDGNMPYITLDRSGSRGNRRLRVEAWASAPIRVGAILENS